MNSKCNALQVLRALLFIMVLGFHCHVPYTEFMWGGVEVFFCISGYYIFKKLIEKKDIPLHIILFDRIKRLYFPLYLIEIIVCNLFLMILMGEFQIRKTLYYFFCIQNYNVFELLRDDNSVTIHTWTICVEIQMIIVIVFITMIHDYFKLSRESVIFNLFCLSIIFGIISYYVTKNFALYSESCLCHAVCFALGGLLYVSKKKGRKLIEDVGSIIIGCLGIAYVCYRIKGLLNYSMVQALLSLNSSNVPLNEGFFITFIIPSLGLIAIGVVSIVMDISNDKCKNAFFISLGDHSFSLYVLHFPVVSGLFLVTKNVWIVFAISFVLTILMAYGYDNLMLKISKKKAGNKK